MKLKSIAAFLFMAAVTVFAAGAEGAQSKTEQKKEHSDVLVVYFSRTGENYNVGKITEGNTAVLAKLIASKTGADVFEIVPEKAYPETYKECTEVAQAERRSNARPAYKGDIDISGYSTVYLGYPIWWGDMPMCVYNFIEKHDFSGKTVFPFCTHEGSGAGGTVRSIRQIHKNAAVRNALAVKGSVAQKDRREAERLVNEWLKK